jgi:hypothetical protein
MNAKNNGDLVDALLDTHGRSSAAEAGIRLRDTPAPLYQLLVLSLLLSARIRASVAVDATRALFDDGMRDPRRMADATWQQRVDALGKGHYRRYDERTSRQLGEGARLLLDKYGGDLRRLRDKAGGRTTALQRLLQELPGIGPTGASIFLREVQAVWPDVAPYIDGKALDGARRLGLPTSRDRLARLVPPDAVAPMTAGLIRAALDKGIAEDVRQHAQAR